MPNQTSTSIKRRQSRRIFYDAGDIVVAKRGDGCFVKAGEVLLVTDVTENDQPSGVLQNSGSGSNWGLEADERKQWALVPRKEGEQPMQVARLYAAAVNFWLATGPRRTPLWKVEEAMKAADLMKQELQTTLDELQAALKLIEARGGPRQFRAKKGEK